MADNKIGLTAKQAAVIEALRATGSKMLAEEVAATNVELFASGTRSVSPLMTHLVRNGYVAKEKQSVEKTNAEGNKVTKELTVYWLTAEGLDLEYEIRASK